MVFPEPHSPIRAIVPPRSMLSTIDVRALPVSSLPAEQYLKGCPGSIIGSVCFIRISLSDFHYLITLISETSIPSVSGMGINHISNESCPTGVVLKKGLRSSPEYRKMASATKKPRLTGTAFPIICSTSVFVPSNEKSSGKV